MATSTLAGLAYRLGRAARCYAGLESQLVRHLSAKGVPAKISWAGIWVLKLVVLLALGFAAFWFAVVVAFVTILWMVSRYGKEDAEAGQWSDGFQGYGYYENGVRTDSGQIFESDTDV